MISYDDPAYIDHDLDRRNKFHLQPEIQAAMPVRENNSHIAERNISLEVTANRPVARIKRKGYKKRQQTHSLFNALSDFRTRFI